jgi:hypothetical protein
MNRCFPIKENLPHAPERMAALGDVAPADLARPCGSWRPHKNETLVACLDHGVVDRLRQRRIVEPWLELLSFAAGREKLTRFRQAYLDGELGGVQ